MDVHVRLIDRNGEFFGYCDVPPLANSNDLAEVIALGGWPGRAYLRDRKSDIETDVNGIVCAIVPCYREVSFAAAGNFQLRSGA